MPVNLVRSFGVLVGMVLFAGCNLASDGSGLSKSTYTNETHTPFPINSLTKHASTTCNDCHGTFDTFKQFECINCHDHEEATTTANHSGVNGFSYDSMSCFSCHPDGTASGGIDHEAFFPIAAGTHSTYATQCSSCHASTTDRTVLACITCHDVVSKPAHSDQAATNSAHTGVAGYAYDSSACYSCHPRGTADSLSTVDHASKFAIGTTSHSSSPCANCHVVPTDLTKISCAATGCHPQTTMDTYHATVLLSGRSVNLGYTAGTAGLNCLKCHAYPSAPSIFRVTQHNACESIRHQGANCLQCHKATLGGTSYNPSTFKPINFGSYTCSDHHHSSACDCTNTGPC